MLYSHRPESAAVQGEVRAKSLDGVGLLEQQRFDDALIRFNEALNFARSRAGRPISPDGLHGQIGSSSGQGNQRESDALLEQALKYVEASNMQVYKADLLLDLAGRAIKAKAYRGCPIASSASCSGVKERWDAQAVCNCSTLNDAALHGCGRFPTCRIVHKRMHNGQQKTC